MNREKAKLIAPFLAVIIGLLLGFILLLVTGNPAVDGYSAMLVGGVKGIGEGNFRRIGDTLALMTPLMFTGISVAFAFKTGLFNIGASGQFFLGGFAAVYVGVMYDLGPFLTPVVALSAALLAGGLIGSLTGYLKAKFNIHEVVTAIMFNYISFWLVHYLVDTRIPGNYETESASISQNASLKAEWLTKVTDMSKLSYSFFIAIAVLVLVYIILEKTTFGYELKAVGYNKHAAKYAGMKVNRNVVLSMAISGAFAGLGGACYYIGYTDHIQITALPNFGFDGIAVSLLGLNAPLGVLLSSFFFGYMVNGGGFMTSATGIPKEIVDIVIAIIVYVSAVSLLLENFLLKVFKPKDTSDVNKDTKTSEQKDEVNSENTNVEQTEVNELDKTSEDESKTGGND